MRLYVHIADVARYVPAGGAVDREALRRGCSVYLPGTVVPMLPPVLSNDACSLRPGVDRPAVTVEMVVGPDGEVGETRFSRTTIRSERRLTYPEVDALFDGRGLGDVALERELLLLRVVAARLGARRRARGALEIGGAEPLFRFDGDRLAGVALEAQTESHRLIEECMIAANEAVARYLIARGTPTVFRYHEDPDPRSVEQLYDRLEALGVATPPLRRRPARPERVRAGHPGGGRGRGPARRPDRERRAGAARPGAAGPQAGLLHTGPRRALGPGQPGATCTSRPPSAATRTSWCTGACSTRWASDRRARAAPRWPRRRSTAPRPSARPRPWSAGATPCAWPSCCATS